MNGNTEQHKPGERIAKVIARAGLASRREAEAWIAAGRVAVNGTSIHTPACNVTAEDRVTVDGAPLPARERTRLFLFHKPRGLMTTHADPQGRPTIFEHLPADLPRLISVGRLDFNTEGLLLLTNDGALARVLELPATGWLRRYRVRAHGKVNQAQLDQLRAGLTLSGIHYGAIEATISRGKTAIVLVPEIALTLWVGRLVRARFGAGVAVLHSHLSSGERHDQWQHIRSGRARIVIGARSAVFAPVDPLGLIIVDEEHEYSYKQEEAPRYHARDVAVVRGRMESAVVVLGSATPSMESFFNVQKGKYRLLELPLRADDKKMPVVRIIDMRQAARREKGAPMFSQELKEAILKRLDRKEQTLLFLNRRGFATSLQCPLCGYVAQCPNCSLALTYHRHAGKLRCHICGHDANAPSVCPEPKCRNPAIRFAGMGTEKVEATLGKLFPRARVQRMDSDTLKRKEDYRRILGDFRTGKIDILVGTQMIAKGLHFPNVTLVGIIYADLGLHMPDFRAGERTFQLLTQVAGRAGRGRGG